MLRKLCLLSILLSGILHSSVSAQTYSLFLVDNPLDIRYPTRTDTAQLNLISGTIIARYRAYGYLDFSIDSVVFRAEKIFLFNYTGNRYRIGEIEMTDDSGNLVFQTLTARYKGTVYDTGFSYRLAEMVLDDNENNGFPFSKVNVISESKEGKIEHKIQIEKGPFFFFDTCIIEGERVIRKSFLEAYTGIRHGMPYNEELFRKAQDKLNRLPFLFSERIPQIAFVHGGYARPFYYLKKRKSDQINGLIGLAPSGSANQSLVLTGEVVLKLNNLFKSGKMININWKSFKARSQELKTGFNYPYIGGLPIGVDLSLNLLKYDTLYTTYQTVTGLQVYTSGVNGFKAYVQVNGTNLGYVDTMTIRSSKRFPEINAVQTRMYGLSAYFNLLDNRFNPLKGWFIDAEGSAGRKTILKDNSISEVKFSSPQGYYSLYDSNSLVSNQYQFKIRLEKFLPLNKTSTVRIAAYSAQMVSPRIYFNELLREGGINSLKGFNEQSIFASNFNMLEIEYRLLIGENSHLKAFWNGAYYEDRSFGRQVMVSDKPWGFGAGANIETGAGILSIMYALGKQKNNPFDLRTGKVHIGISSYF